MLDRYGRRTPEELAEEPFGARYTPPGAGTLKAVAVLEAATRLKDLGIDVRRDLLERSPDVDGKGAWLSVGGLGVASWRYLLLLSGAEEVKPDIMIRRFVADAIGDELRRVPASRAAALFEEAHRRLREDHPASSLRALDHAVWRVHSGRDLR